jgi:lysophospholipase L1-like esterase
VLIWGLSRALDIDLERITQLARLRFSSPSPLGIHVLDSEMGTRLAPNSIGRHETREFKVMYSIDSAGARRVPGAKTNRPIVEVLGDSFTFGYGVEDSETYSAVLQDRLGPSIAVRNRGVMGWSTTQNMIALQRDLAGVNPIQLAIYGWLPFHNQRNYRSKGWLETLGKQGQRLPMFELVHGRLVFQRLIGPEDGLPDGTDEIRRREWEITEAAILEMASLTAAQAAHFLMVLLPFQIWMGPLGSTSPSRVTIQDYYARLERFLKDKGISYLNLWQAPQFSGDDLYIPNDMHPTARWHRLVATALEEVIQVNTKGIVAVDVSRYQYNEKATP